MVKIKIKQIAQLSPMVDYFSALSFVLNCIFYVLLFLLYSPILLVYCSLGTAFVLILTPSSNENYKSLPLPFPGNRICLFERIVPTSGRLNQPGLGIQKTRYACSISQAKIPNRFNDSIICLSLNQIIRKSSNQDSKGLRNFRNSEEKFYFQNLNY